jgi:hypothetical protein
MEDEMTTGTSSAVPPPRKPKTRKTKAHDVRELAAVLGWTDGQIARALAAGVLPPFDMRTPRWSGATVDALAARAGELAAAIPDLADDAEVRQVLGLGYGDFKRGRDAGAVPGPDVGEFWSRALLEEMAGRAQEIGAAIPPQPLGVRRCAELAAERTGLDVTDDDVRVLIDRGLLPEAGWYKQWPLYDVGALTAMTGSDDGRAVLAGIVGDRIAWLAASITGEDAATWLDCDARDLERVAAEQGIAAGRFGRWAREDVARLAADEDLADELRRARLLGPDQAAEHMEIRRRDFEYVRAAGWVAPARWIEREVGVRKTVDVPLFAVGDLEGGSPRRAPRAAVPAARVDAPARPPRRGDPRLLRRAERDVVGRGVAALLERRGPVGDRLGDPLRRA